MPQDIQITPTADMPPVVTESTSGTQGGSSERTIQSPEAATAATEVSNAANDVATAEDAVAKAVAAQAKAQADAKDFIAKNAETQVAEQERLQKERQPIIDIARAEADKAEQRYANHKFYDWWGSLSTGDRIIGRMGIALNQFANSGLGRAGNETADMIQNTIRQDFNKQMAQLHSKQQLAEWKKAGVKDLYGQLQDEMNALRLKQARAQDAVAAKAEAMCLRAGMSVDEAKQNVVSAKARQAAAQLRLEAAQRYEKKATDQHSKTTGEQITSAKGGTGGGVEAQKNAGQLAVIKEHGAWMAGQMPKLSPEDVATINRVIGSEQLRKNWPGVAGALSAIGVDPETGASPLVKEYIDRLHRYEEAFGRLESGGAIGKEEAVSFQDSARPRVSDSPKDRAMRAQNLTKDIQLRDQYMGKPSASANAAPGTRTATTKDEVAAVALAQVRYKKNPKDEKAKRVLEMFGKLPKPETPKAAPKANAPVAPTQPPPFVQQ